MVYFPTRFAVVNTACLYMFYRAFYKRRQTRSKAKIRREPRSKAAIGEGDVENVNKKEKEERGQAGKSSGRCHFVAKSSWYPEEIVVISKRDILPPGEEECGSEDDKWEVGVVGWLAARHDHHQSARPETEKSFCWWWWAKSRSNLIILAIIICSLHFCHIINLEWMNAAILLLIPDHLLKRLSNHFHRDKLKLNLRPKFHHYTVTRISVKIEGVVLSAATSHWPTSPSIILKILV